MGVVEHAVRQSQFAPPPLTEEFTILLNLHSDVKNLLDGFLEAVKVVVNQSCEGQTEDTSCLPQVRHIETGHAAETWKPV